MLLWCQTDQSKPILYSLSHILVAFSFIFFRGKGTKSLMLSYFLALRSKSNSMDYQIKMDFEGKKGINLNMKKTCCYLFTLKINSIYPNLCSFVMYFLDSSENQQEPSLLYSFFSKKVWQFHLCVLKVDIS